MPGYINADAFATPCADVIFDCQKPWPFDDDTFVEVAGIHMLEHLDDYRSFFKEAWRCLHPTGHLRLQLPYGLGHSAWVDVDHKRPWLPENFCFLQPGYGESVHNAQHAWQHPFWITWLGLRLHPKAKWFVRMPVFRQFFIRNIEFYPQFISEIVAILAPIKDAQRLEDFKKSQDAQWVKCEFIMSGPEFKRGMEPGSLVNLGRISFGFAYH